MSLKWWILIVQSFEDKWNDVRAGKRPISAFLTNESCMAARSSKGHYILYWLCHLWKTSNKSWVPWRTVDKGCENRDTLPTHCGRKRQYVKTVGKAKVLGDVSICSQNSQSLMMLQFEVLRSRHSFTIVRTGMMSAVTSEQYISLDTEYIELSTKCT